MLTKKGSQFQLYPHKVKYTQHGKEQEQWATPSKEWWVEFTNKWEHTQIIEFTEVTLTDEQLARFEEIKNMPEDFTSVYMDYVLDGTFPNEEFPKTHPFMMIKAQKENEQLQAENANLIFTNAIQEGKISDLESENANILFEIAMIKGGTA
jgi:hypothetical protein